MLRRVFRLALTLALWGMAAALWAAEPIFELKDGTQVRGNIEGMAAGVYTVRTASLGVVRIDADQIKTIHYSGRVESSASAPDYRADIESLQMQMAKDTGAMSLIMGLQSDPQIQAVLADPEILNAIQRGDLSSLMQNEKFMKLMENPKLKAVTSQISGR